MFLHAGRRKGIRAWSRHKFDNRTLDDCKTGPGERIDDGSIRVGLNVSGLKTGNSQRWGGNLSGRFRQCWFLRPNRLGRFL